MLKIDESCIKSVTAGQPYGNYEIVGEIGEHRVDLSYCGGENPLPIEADERRVAIDAALDHLRVVSTQERLIAAQIVLELRGEWPIEITDEELREAILAAGRIGEEEIDDIVGMAWSRGLLELKPEPPKLAALKPDEVDANFLDLARAMEGAGMSDNVVNLSHHRPPVTIHIQITLHGNGETYATASGTDPEHPESRAELAACLRHMADTLEDPDAVLDELNQGELP